MPRESRKKDLLGDIHIIATAILLVWNKLKRKLSPEAPPYQSLAEQYCLKQILDKKKNKT